MDQLPHRRLDDSSANSSSKRRRVPEACHACRKRKAKCDGLRPCSFCQANNIECVFDAQMVSLGGVERSLLYLPESVKLLSERVSNIEQYLREASDRDRHDRISPKFQEPQQASSDELEERSEPPIIESGGEGVTAVGNLDESRSTQYYGASSTVAIASDLYQAATSPIANQKTTGSSPAARRIEEHSGIEALLNPETTATEDYTPRKPVTSNLDDITNRLIADRHLANYFETIHTLIPVLHEKSFRALYNAHWSRISCQTAASPRTDSNLSRITAPFIYSVLALGALYEDYNDSNFWAKEWFAKAREGISNAVEECCFEMCLAVYFVASYAQHVIKPNLAYNYLGVAIRLAYSIGLNRSSVTVAYSEAAWPGVCREVVTEMCKRIWWQMYTLEVEIALDSGRPICIRNSDIDVEWPVEVDDNAVRIDQSVMYAQTNGPSKIAYLICVSRFSRIIRKVLKLLYPVKKKGQSLSAITESLVDLDRQFCEWRDNLPQHLALTSPTSIANSLNEPQWLVRSRGALAVHFNHIYIVMHRPLLTVPHFSTPFLSSERSHEMGITAAKENITLIHTALQSDPPLRKWMYYCYYNFMAELVLLTMLIKQPFAEEAREWYSYCNMAIQAFEWMRPLDAAVKSLTMSKTFVDEWKAKVEVGPQLVDKRRRSYNPEAARIRSQSQSHTSNTGPAQINYLLQQPPPNTAFQQSFMQTNDFPTPVHISPQGSDSSYSPLNPTRYDVQPGIAYSTTQTLDAAAAETLQSFSGTSWPNQGIFAGDAAMGWTYNFEDLFGDLSRPNMGGQGGM